MELIVDGLDSETKEFWTPAKSGMGYLNAAGASGKEVSHLVKRQRGDKTQGEINDGSVHFIVLRKWIWNAVRETDLVISGL